MFLDGMDIGLEKVQILDSHARINNIDLPIKCINIYSSDDNYKFTFWTRQEYQKYNDLELNKKTDILGLIDDYDIDFASKDFCSINTRENTNMFFTRIDNDKYLLEVLIDDFGNYYKDKYKINNLKIETIIDFNK